MFFFFFFFVFFFFFFCLPTVKRGSSNGGKSYEKYRNPALFYRKSGFTIGYPALRLDAVILWRSGLGLLMGKFSQFLTELSARERFIFSFPDASFSKYQWNFTKLGECMNIVGICFENANGRISYIF